MKTITASMLVKAGACHDQLKLFRETFPRGCRLTLANVKKAISVGLDVEWAVRHFAAEPAEDAYRTAVKPARNVLFATIESVQDACRAATVAATVAAIESARDAYNAAIAPHVLRALLGD